MRQETVNLVPRRAAMEGNLAAVVGQLQVNPDLPSRLQIDSRELLATTTRIVGARFGEIEVDTYLAMCARYVDLGKPGDGGASSTIRALAKTLYGSSLGGANRAQVTKAMINLFRMEVQMAGVRAGTGEFDRQFLDFERLLVSLRFDRQIRLRQTAPDMYDPVAIGAQRNSTVHWQFAPWHVEQLQNGYWVELDWDKLRSLSGAAKMLWLVLSSPRIPFVPSPGAPGLEELRVPLTPESYRVFGISASRERDCKRSLEQAGRRLVAVDDSYIEVMLSNEARSRGRILRVVRRRSEDQLSFAALPPLAA
ncbi:MAG: hypothetical protein ACM31K_05995 [Solirubrobacterales bacterium]